MANILSYRIGYVQKPQLALNLVAELGIKHLEIVMQPDQSVADIQRILEPHGLQVCTLQAVAAIDQDDFVSRFADFAARGAALGARGLYSSVKAGDMPRDKVYDKLRQVGDVVGEKGLFVALETHPDLCENGDKARETLAAVNHPAIGWNLDTANIYYYNENVNVIEEATKAAPYIRSLHAKDTNGGFKDPTFPNLGEGIVDYAAVGKVLQGVSFSGPWTLELEGVAGSAGSVEKMAANVATCANHLRRLGLVA